MIYHFTHLWRGSRLFARRFPELLPEEARAKSFLRQKIERLTIQQLSQAEKENANNLKKIFQIILHPSPFRDIHQFQISTLQHKLIELNDYKKYHGTSMLIDIYNQALKIYRQDISQFKAHHPDCSLEHFPAPFHHLKIYHSNVTKQGLDLLVEFRSKQQPKFFASLEEQTGCVFLSYTNHQKTKEHDPLTCIFPKKEVGLLNLNQHFITQKSDLDFFFQNGDQITYLKKIWI